MISSSAITAVILAGGAGRRLGGVDKGWLELGGKSLVESILAVLHDQVATVVISANTNTERYAALGYPVIADPPGDAGGPLAGVAACWDQVRTRYLWLLPVDAAIVPEQLLSALKAGLMDADAAIARARMGADVHPTCALIDRSRVAPPSQPGGSLMGWQRRYAVVDVAVEPGAVLSVNTPEEYSALTARSDQTEAG